MSFKLENCPFCESEVKLVDVFEESLTKEQRKMFPWKYIECANCNWATRHARPEELEELISMWNRRPKLKENLKPAPNTERDEVLQHLKLAKKAIDKSSFILAHQHINLVVAKLTPISK